MAIQGLATSPLATMAHEAMRRAATRLAVLFTATAAVATPLAVTGALSAPAAVVLLLCLACVAVSVQAYRHQVDNRWGALALATLTITSVALVLSADAGAIDTAAAGQMTNWLTSGMGAATAFTRGPRWGVSAALLGLAPSAIAAASVGSLLPVSVVIGPITYLVGAALVRRAALKGYAETEEAMAATEAAETAVRVAEQRWDAAREAQRRLHDTVLATLTMLSHRGEGVSAELLAAACARDAEILRGGRSGPATPRTVWLPPPDGEAAAAQGVSLHGVVHESSTTARLAGLDVRVHLPSADAAAPRLDPVVAAAVGQALRECLENVRRHAGVLAADVTVVAEGEAASVIVVDEGVGFDPACVPEDRLGLRDTVHEQLRRVGGQVTVWSGIDRGTSVLLSVPVAGTGRRARLR